MAGLAAKHRGFPRFAQSGPGPPPASERSLRDMQQVSRFLVDVGNVAEVMLPFEGRSECADDDAERRHEGGK